MISREEKNKEIVNEIRKEQARNISKKILHITTTIIIILLLLFSYIYFIGVKGLTTNEFVIKNSSIPKSFHGIKIVHITDLLYGREIDSKYLNKLQEEIKLINPNIITFTGNIFNNNYTTSEEDIKNINTFFKNLPYTIGKYAIKGNLDTRTFDLIMDNTDFTILNNESITIYNNSQESINIIGINYNDKATINKENDFYTITLINNYDYYKEYNVSSNLVLAGNNLGGEIRLFNLPLLGNNKYNNSYYEENNTKIYISSGIGSLHHMRFMNHPSINVYRLINTK